MNKTLLYNSIKKVFLDLKDVEHFIFWDIKDSRLFLKSLDTAYNTSVMSKVAIPFESRVEQNLILKDPDSVLKVLDLYSDEVDIKILSDKGYSIILNDGNFKSEIVVTDPNYVSDHIKENKEMEADEPISYDVVFHIDTAFMEKFIKAKKANKSENISIWTKERKTFFQLGDSNNFSNKIEFSIEQEGMFDMEKLIYSSTIMQNIFDRNKKSKGTIFVDGGGLMKLSFIENEIESNYFLVCQDNI